MTQSRAWLASAAVIALLFGLEFPDPKLSGEPSPLPNDHTMVLAAGERPTDQRQTEESADESAKMAKPGTQTGEEISAPENDGMPSADTPVKTFVRLSISKDQ